MEGFLFSIFGTYPTYVLHDSSINVFSGHSFMTLILSPFLSLKHVEQDELTLPAGAAAILFSSASFANGVTHAVNLVRGLIRTKTVHRISAGKLRPPPHTRTQRDRERESAILEARTHSPWTCRSPSRVASASAYIHFAPLQRNRIKRNPR